jgi:hypothetical protein
LTWLTRLLNRSPVSPPQAASPPVLDCAALDALGFFRYVAPQDRERVFHQLAESRDVSATLQSLAGQAGGITRRLYGEDPESLAESGELDFLGRLAPLLRTQGIRMDVTYAERKFPAFEGRPAGRAAAQLDADGWLVEQPRASIGVQSLAAAFTPGAEPCPLIWGDNRESFLANDREIELSSIEGQYCKDHWACTLHAVLGLIDELLSAHGSDERATADYCGDNSMLVVVGTPEMTRLFNSVMQGHRGRLFNATELRALAVPATP